MAETIDIEAIRSEARDQERALAAEITALCTLAKKPGMATQFLNERKTKAEVTAWALQQSAEADEKLVTAGGVNAATGAEPSGGQALPWDQVMAQVGVKNFGKRGAV